jgi:hypothetical protein
MTISGIGWSSCVFAGAVPVSSNKLFNNDRGLVSLSSRCETLGAIARREVTALFLGGHGFLNVDSAQSRTRARRGRGNDARCQCGAVGEPT